MDAAVRHPLRDRRSHVICEAHGITIPHACFVPSGQNDVAFAHQIRQNLVVPLRAALPKRQDAIDLFQLDVSDSGFDIGHLVVQMKCIWWLADVSSDLNYPGNEASIVGRNNAAFSAGYKLGCIEGTEVQCALGPKWPAESRCV